MIMMYAMMMLLIMPLVGTCLCFCFPLAIDVTNTRSAGMSRRHEGSYRLPVRVYHQYLSNNKNDEEEKEEEDYDDYAFSFAATFDGTTSRR